MAEVDKYNVHDITIADKPSFDGRGNVTNQRFVSYWIGIHGPFTAQGKPEDFTTAKLKEYIEAHQSELRGLDDIGSAPAAL
jgi:hypothetical protein